MQRQHQLQQVIRLRQRRLEQAQAQLLAQRQRCDDERQQLLELEASRLRAEAALMAASEARTALSVNHLSLWRHVVEHHQWQQRAFSQAVDHVNEQRAALQKALDQLHEMQQVVLQTQQRIERLESQAFEAKRQFVRARDNREMNQIEDDFSARAGARR